ncbi:MAG: hypothetical protein KC897_09420 [Candidatus Omnitrophica bacterium]|nr:hypothetical protein [Candidatus Omnitrophota bacterium]MCB9721202.1 hypothetical protein [Candidatus Omnitrophota bacterium]
MTNDTPFAFSKEQLSGIIDKIASDSSVGIDTRLTHAVIIAYLQRIEARLERVEQSLNLQD